MGRRRLADTVRRCGHVGPAPGLARCVACLLADGLRSSPVVRVAGVRRRAGQAAACSRGVGTIAEGAKERSETGSSGKAHEGSPAREDHRCGAEPPADLLLGTKGASKRTEGRERGWGARSEGQLPEKRMPADAETNCPACSPSSLRTSLPTPVINHTGQILKKAVQMPSAPLQPSIPAVLSPSHAARGGVGGREPRWGSGL